MVVAEGNCLCGNDDMQLQDDNCVCTGDHPLFATHQFVLGTYVPLDMDFGCSSCGYRVWEGEQLYDVVVEDADVVFDRIAFPDRIITQHTHCCPEGAQRNLVSDGSSNVDVPCICEGGFIWMNMTCTPCPVGTIPNDISVQLAFGDGESDYSACAPVQAEFTGR